MPKRIGCTWDRSAGLFWVDLSEKKPRIKGPSVRKRIVKIEFAPELQKNLLRDG